MPPLPAFTHSPKNDQPYALTVKPVRNGSGIDQRLSSGGGGQLKIGITCRNDQI